MSLGTEVNVNAVSTTSPTAIAAISILPLNAANSIRGLASQPNWPTMKPNGPNKKRNHPSAQVGFEQSRTIRGFVLFETAGRVSDAIHKARANQRSPCLIGVRRASEIIDANIASLCRFGGLGHRMRYALIPKVVILINFACRFCDPALSFVHPATSHRRDAVFPIVVLCLHLAHLGHFGRPGRRPLLGFNRK